MDADNYTALDTVMQDLRAHIIQNTSVLILMANNSASRLYSQNFIPSLLICDKDNHLTITNSIILIIHYEPDTIIIVGDTKQLRPIVTDLTPLVGFLPELMVLIMSYFLEPGQPSETIDIQRQAHTEIMDIPVHRYYYADVQNRPDADLDKIFYYITTVIDIIEEICPDAKVAQSPAMYLDIERSCAILDLITKSRFNLQYVALVVNVIATFASKGVPLREQGVVTLYMA